MATAAMERSVQEEVSAEEWAVRVDLAAAYRLVALYGWDDLIFTHLSARVPGPEHHFLINPYHLMFEEITASSLVKIDHAGKPVGRPAMVNAAGFVIHSAIHMAREDAGAVLHLHTPYGQAVSAMDEGLLPQTQTAMIAGQDLAYHEYEGIATDLEERERLVEDLGDGRYRLTPRTGRTHQLRVHMASLGLPIHGDPLYPSVIDVAPDDFSRPLQLLAHSIEFDDPIRGCQRRFVSGRRLDQ